MKLSAVVAMSCVAVATAQKNKNKRPFSFHENRVNAAQAENRIVFKVFSEFFKNYSLEFTFNSIKGH